MGHCSVSFSSVLSVTILLGTVGHLDMAPKRAAPTISLDIGTAAGNDEELLASGSAEGGCTRPRTASYSPNISIIQQIFSTPEASATRCKGLQGPLYDACKSNITSRQHEGHTNIGVHGDTAETEASQGDEMEDSGPYIDMQQWGIPDNYNFDIDYGETAGKTLTLDLGDPDGGPYIHLHRKCPGKGTDGGQRQRRFEKVAFKPIPEGDEDVKAIVLDACEQA
ncbi:hypothetical protein Vafri_16335, partial [Volvox africanus]